MTLPSMVAETGSELQHMLDVLDRACARWGMQISASKTKILTVEEQGKDQQVRGQSSITLRGQALEEVESFFYLSSEVAECRGRERSCSEAGVGWQSVPNVEEESLQEL